MKFWYHCLNIVFIGHEETKREREGKRTEDQSLNDKVDNFLLKQMFYLRLPKISSTARIYFIHLFCTFRIKMIFRNFWAIVFVYNPFYCINIPALLFFRFWKLSVPYAWTALFFLLFVKHQEFGVLAFFLKQCQWFHHFYFSLYDFWMVECASTVIFLCWFD